MSDDVSCVLEITGRCNFEKILAKLSGVQVGSSPLYAANAFRSVRRSAQFVQIKRWLQLGAKGYLLEAG